MYLFPLFLSSETKSLVRKSRISSLLFWFVLRFASLLCCSSPLCEGGLIVLGPALIKILIGGKSSQDDDEDDDDDDGNESKVRSSLVLFF
jgi:hypothetical protein